MALAQSDRLVNFSYAQYYNLGVYSGQYLYYVFYDIGEYPRLLEYPYEI